MEESLFLYEPAFRDARLLSGPHAWLGHLPFITWIVEIVQRGLIEEIEDYTCTSNYFSCQSLRQFSIGTRCYVATESKEDQHLGHPGQNVIQRISEIKRHKQNAFSRVIRSNIDRSVSRFQGASIDLLHNDELHPYITVEHEPESLLPRLSDSAVILCLYGSVNLPVLGVEVFLDELGKCHLALELIDSSVMGIVGVGRQLPHGVRQHLNVPAANTQSQNIRLHTARLGDQSLNRFMLPLHETSIEERQLQTRSPGERCTALQERMQQTEEKHRDSQDRSTASETDLEDHREIEIHWEHQRFSRRILNRVHRISKLWSCGQRIIHRCLSGLNCVRERFRIEGAAVACRCAIARIATKSREVARKNLQVVRAISERGFDVARRFGAIARSDGLSVALKRAWRRVRRRSHCGLGRSCAGIASFGQFRLDFVPPRAEDPYECWRHMNQDSPRRRRSLLQATGTAHGRPFFSVIMPIYNSPSEVLDAAISSVASQSFHSWELILVDDASTKSHVKPMLESWSTWDQRIRVLYRCENANISVATNQAAEAARGEWLVLLDHDDLLDLNALAFLSVYIDEYPNAQIIYTDDDKVDLKGRHHSPQFKPGWSPELLLSYCYTGHLTAVRRCLYHDLGGMRIGFEGSQDHDFWLRASERATGGDHVAQLLYHWRVLPGSTAVSGHAKPHSFEAGRKAVEEALCRRGVSCSVVQPDWAVRAGCAVFQPVMPDEGPSVALLIPSKNNEKSLERLLRSLQKTTYRNYHIYIIDNASDDLATLNYVAKVPHQVLRIPCSGGIFNFAAINNRAAEMVKEEILLFLNCDIEVIEPRWLSQMVGWLSLSGVGVVGARLLFPDRRIKHAGIVHGLHDGHAEHAFQNLPRWDAGYLNLARVTRNCLAVTAACMLTPRELFLRMGGFDEERFGLAYNDADYCYRLIDSGLRCVYCAEAELYHYERTSKRPNENPREAANYREVHGHRTDPYYSSHLNPHSVLFEVRPTVVAASPRVRRIPLLAVSHNLNWEGAPRFEFELISRLKKAGCIDPIVLSPSDGPLRKEYDKAGVRIEVDPELSACLTDKGRYQAVISKLSERIVQGGFDVVHANTLQSFWAIDAARHAQIPSVWSLHESEHWQSYYNHLPREIAGAALSSFAHPYRIVFTARSTLEAWSALESTKNFDLIRFALDADRFQAELATADREGARNELGLEDEDLCVLLLGTVCERKGQLDLLRAYAALSADLAVKVRCLVVGARDSLAYSRKLREMAAELSLDRRDRFRIFNETGETAKFWKAADIFCCSSRVESYPHVVLEAMSAGLPIITTPVFGIIEQVQADVNALFYDPGDVKALAGHLESLLKRNAYRRSLANRSPWVLRGLPTCREMDEKYRRTFQAAAESSVIANSKPANGVRLPSEKHSATRLPDVPQVIHCAWPR